MYTFNFGFEMWIFVKHCHLLFPVKLVSPIGNHFLQIFGIKAILEVGVLQGISVASPVDALMKVLLNASELVFFFFYSFFLNTAKKFAMLKQRLKKGP